MGKTKGAKQIVPNLEDESTGGVLSLHFRKQKTSSAYLGECLPTKIGLRRNLGSVLGGEAKCAAPDLSIAVGLGKAVKNSVPN